MYIFIPLIFLRITSLFSIQEYYHVFTRTGLISDLQAQPQIQQILEVSLKQAVLLRPRRRWLLPRFDFACFMQNLLLLF